VIVMLIGYPIIFSFIDSKRSKIKSFFLRLRIRNLSTHF
jgi:hypothetical protein